MRSRALLVGLVMIASVGLVVIAIGATASDETGESPESAQSGVRGEGVPEGPFIDFCPTLEQTEAHLEEYGFDYKPTVACGPDGEVDASAYPDDSEEPSEEDSMTDEEFCEANKEKLLETEPVESESSHELRGVKPDGGEIYIEVDGEIPEGIDDIHDWARSSEC